MTGQIATTFLGNDLVWWTGILGGVFFVLLVITAAVKQYNFNIFMKWQVRLTSLHHWFGWLSVGFLLLHFLLAIFQFNFHVFF